MPRRGPRLIGFARWVGAQQLVRLGARNRASAVLTEGIDELTPSVRLGATDTVPAEMVG